MTAHEEFYTHLAQIELNGEDLIKAYNDYKQSNGEIAFELNGCLISEMKLDGSLAEFYANLCQIIRARNNDTITLYRMTSDTQFIGPLAPALLGQSFAYPAFLSTSGSKANLHSFSPAETPVLLEIACPSNTAMALMESDGGMEDEYLLGCHTKYQVEQAEIVNDPEVLTECLPIGHGKDSLIRIRLIVVGNPAYTESLPPWQFDQDVPPEVEEI